MDDSYLKHEVYRKLIHMSFLILTPIAYFSKQATLSLLLLGAVAYPVMYFIMPRFFVPFLRVLSRDWEIGRLPLGPLFLDIGLLGALLFPAPYFTAGLFAVTLGDGFASIGGKFFGGAPSVGNKTATGSLCVFGVTYIALSCLFPSETAKVLFLSFITATLELIPIRDVDNLIIPFVIAFCSFLF